MNARAKKSSEELGLGDNPLASDDVLVDTFYAPPPAAAKKAAPKAKKKSSGRGRRMPLKDGASFRLVTFSFYEEDVARLDKLLADARKKGKRKASRSQIVRLALRQVDVSLLPDEV
jgi:hypothetical protein